MSFESEESDWQGGDPAEPVETGPWPAFVDLFAATTLIMLVFFVVIAARYVGERGTAVKVRELTQALTEQQKESGGSGFVIQEQPPDVLVILEERVTFKTMQWTLESLQDPAKETLRRVDSIMRSPRFKGLIREIEIVGHADRRGTSKVNWQLSTDRAMTVARFLVDSLHDDPCIIVPSGRGAFFPRDFSVRPETLSPARRDSVYASDRRIEVLLHPTVANARNAGRAGCLRP